MKDFVSRSETHAKVFGTWNLRSSLGSQILAIPTDSHSSSERSERFVRFEPNVRSERVRYFSERETNVQALKRLINLIAVK